MEETLGKAMRSVYNDSYEEPKVEETFVPNFEVVEEVAETAQNQTEAAEQPQVETPAADVQTPEIDDEIVLRHIASKTGKQVSSFEDLFKTEEKIVEKESFVSDEIKAINDFVKETGKTVSDFYELRKITSQEMDDAQKVKLKMMYDNPDLSAKEVELLFKRQFKKVEITDDMDDSEREAAMEENTFADILLKKEARIASEFIGTLAEKIKAPAPKNEEPYNKDEYKKLWNEATQTVQDLTFGLTQDKNFTWKVDADEKKFFEQPITPDAFVKEYINSDGTWDMAKWAKDIYTLKTLPKIIRSAAALRSGEGVEELIDTVKAVPTTKTTDGSPSTKAVSLAKAMFSRT